jgi:hypothetical protein
VCVREQDIGEIPAPLCECLGHAAETVFGRIDQKRKAGHIVANKVAVGGNRTALKCENIEHPAKLLPSVR